MSGNIQPQFTTNGNVSAVSVINANTGSEGVGIVGNNNLSAGGVLSANPTTATMFIAFTAGVNGSFIESVLWNPQATTATTTTACTGRVFLSSNTGSLGSLVNSTNTWLLGEVSLPAVGAASTTVPTYPVELVLNRRIPASYTILVSNGVVPTANTAWLATVFGGDY